MLRNNTIFAHDYLDSLMSLIRNGNEVLFLNNDDEFFIY